MLTESQLSALRRDLHQNPELSHEEARTSGVVFNWLHGWGFQIRRRVAGRGLIATLEGPHPGPTLLLRADMDALPIQEEASHDYASQVPGVMHACGHDVHTTVAIGVAMAISARWSELAGTIKFVFQPAEEAAPKPGEVIGAERMVRQGALKSPDVDAAFAFHVMPELEVGAIGYTGGPVWAGSDLFDIRVRGKMSHGAYPHNGRDPIAAGAAIVQALQQIPSRIIDARDACVVSVGRFEGGNAYNIIPSEVQLQGLVRTLNEEVRAQALDGLKRVVESTAQAWGCEAELETVRGAWPTENDPALERFFGESVARHHPDIPFVPFRPQMGAEDFSAFSRRVPGCYLFLGVRNEERGITSQLHTPTFDVDEASLAIGVRAMTDALLDAGQRWEELKGTLKEFPAEVE